MGEAARKLGVTEQTYYRLARENTRLKRLVKVNGDVIIFLSPRAFLSIIGESLVLDYDLAVARSISLSKRKKPFSLFGREWAQRLMTSTAICSFNQKFSGFVCFNLQIICAQSSARSFDSLGESSELRKCLFRKLCLLFLS